MVQQTPRDMPLGRAKLIDAALSCMANFGQDGTTVRVIADHAGVTPGLVKHHFGSKEGLLVETYRHLNERTVTRISNALHLYPNDVGAALESVIQALFPSDLSDVRKMRVLVAFWGLVLTNPRFAEVQAETNAQTRRLLCDLIAQHSSDPDATDDVADGIIAITDGLWLECCMNPGRMTPEKAVQIATKLARGILRIDRA
ncbi:TetR/AcrR family transcriptional regulator [Marivita sp. S6314]|uniref:TetR/AcrR family transcriptional regulator n=1 Tax=Marivita sp. S6314 TaxID=2926406 RepID=UPI001FF3C086|nr:TetR/AcrR family transcriptional regulator [Marivita sp. S6314]MCK0150854.1 TetR/AcrR family transcriptional regulator [Marivita sp. S6314]